MTYRSPEDFLARGIFLDPIKPGLKKKNGHAFSGMTTEIGAPPPFDVRFPPPLGETAEARPPAHAKGFIEFFSQYRPINYTIDGILPGGSIYGLTAKRSSGKTAFLTGSALAVLADRGDILGFDVEQGRVAYIILENPIDFLMKLSVTAYTHGIDVQALDNQIAIFDMRRPHEEIMRALRENAERFGPFQLVNYDTFQAGFAGASFNDNTDALNHARNLRELTTLPGNPSALVACHPVKNAAKDLLEPYGGGSTMNEFDGNLTLWKDQSGVIELHHNKVRGPEFEPLHFRIEKIGSPEVLDNKKRQPQLPVLYPMSREAVDQREETKKEKQQKQDIALLKAMASEPGASIRNLATTAELDRSWVERALKRLELAKSGKLVANTLGRWNLTKAGREAVANV
jgi:hypothetical protein